MRLTTLTLLGAALCASPALAQRIAYDSGDYLYAQAPETKQANDAVTESTQSVGTPASAERVIGTRRSAGQPIFRPRPIIQALPEPAGTERGVSAPRGGNLADAPGTAPARIAPSPYELRESPGSAPTGLPPGAQLVAFDRQAWLTACRDRLATYPEKERDAALAALGGAAMGYSPGQDGCAAYLDSYLARASSGAAMPGAEPGAVYMLVPVTMAAHAPQK